jgi:hypothetical protein
VELPPQIVKDQVRQVAAVHGGFIAGGTGIQPFGSRLPVLQAFQEFLEIERRKTRRRLVATALIFLGILLAVIAASAVLFARFSGRIGAEVRRLERALAAAYDEQSAIREDSESMRQALAEARDALEALRARVESEDARAPTIDFATVAMSLDALRRLQDLQSEYSEHARRVDALAREADSIGAAQKAFTDRRMAWRAEWRALESRLEAHSAHRRAAVARMAEALARLDRPASGSDRGRGSRKRAQGVGAEAAPDLASAWLAMEELNQSKFTLAPLAMDLDRIEREAAELDALRREIFDRSNAWRSNVLEAAHRIVVWRSHIAAISADRDHTFIRD